MHSHSNLPSASTSTSSNSTKADMSQSSSNHNPWALWVKETFPDSPSPTLSDRHLPTSTTAAVTATRSPVMTERSFNKNSSKSNDIVLTTDQIDLVLSDPIRCFCGKPAHRVYTLEYGPVLECGTFDMEQADSQKSKFICGFHVHETSWISFRNLLKDGNTVNSEYSELRTCPQYNFTYCAMFHIKNEYKLDPSTKLPECFCRRPVAMRVHNKDAIQFACKNAFIDGARKCSWVLNAKDVAFPRPKQRIHNHVSRAEYFVRKERQKDELSSLRANQKQQKEEQHKSDLLATLSASITPVSTPPLLAYVQMSEEEDCKDKIISFKDLALQEQQLHGTPIIKSLMVPTCVMSNQKKQHQKQPIPSSTSSSSSFSSTITSPVISSPPSSQEIRMLEETCYKQRVVIEQQKGIIERQKDTLQLERETSQQAAIEIARFKKQTDDLETKLLHSQHDQDEQIALRMSCQERLSDIELDVVRLMNEKEKLTEELMVHIEDKNSLGKEEESNKCKLCYSKNIEYCLIPCYHFGKFSFVIVMVHVNLYILV